ncbi:MerR family transcriptional regulator [Microbacterium sp.]|uniref:MerR family transcriptional regulator n=1 Tax=Microbacterium sp. TaxID=51671 RepID=UPI0033411EBF
MAERGETVGVVAARLGLTVRTLHHWDALGLASPSARTPGGYRSYDDADIARLRRVALLRDLGVPLDRIRTLLDGDAAARREELTARRRDLDERIRHLREVASAVDRLLEADASGPLLTADQVVEVFGVEWDPGWSAEARERWGDSAQWAEYAEHAAQRTPDDWRMLVGEMDGVFAAFAQAQHDGIDPESEQGIALAERHRAAMGAFFHCTVPMQVVLSRAFTDDPEYAAFFDRRSAGLGGWIRRAVEASARSQGVDPATAVWE